MSPKLNFYFLLWVGFMTILHIRVRLLQIVGDLDTQSTQNHVGDICQVWLRHLSIQCTFYIILPVLIWQHPTENALACGCDLAWIVTNMDYLSKISQQSTCSDGTMLNDLDPQIYIDLCFF